MIKSLNTCEGASACRLSNKFVCGPLSNRMIGWSSEMYYTFLNVRFALNSCVGISSLEWSQQLSLISTMKTLFLCWVAGIGRSWRLYFYLQYGIYSNSNNEVVQSLQACHHLLTFEYSLLCSRITDRLKQKRQQNSHWRFEIKKNSVAEVQYSKALNMHQRCQRNCHFLILDDNLLNHLMLVNLISM